MAAIVDHPIFSQPDGESAIWKYMPLSQFLYLLQKRSLWFTRMDLFNDPFEGKKAEVIIDLMAKESKYINTEKEKTYFKNTMKARQKVDRMSTFINCWSLNDHESMAMWSVYCKDEFSVALKTSYANLVDALPNYVYIGQVLYQDYTEIEKVNNAFYYLNRKLNAFNYENEIRALIYDYQIEEKIISDYKETEEGMFYNFDIEIEKGKEISISINSLVQEIHLNPNYPKWYDNVIIDLCEKYQYTNKIVTSDLDSRVWSLI